MQSRQALSVPIAGNAAISATAISATDRGRIDQRHDAIISQRTAVVCLIQVCSANDFLRNSAPQISADCKLIITRSPSAALNAIAMPILRTLTSGLVAARVGVAIASPKTKLTLQTSPGLAKTSPQPGRGRWIPMPFGKYTGRPDEGRSTGEEKPIFSQSLESACAGREPSSAIPPVERRRIRGTPDYESVGQEFESLRAR